MGGATLFPSYIKTPASGPDHPLIAGLVRERFYDMIPVAQPKLMRVLGVTLGQVAHAWWARSSVCQGSKSGVPAAVVCWQALCIYLIRCLC